MANRVGEHFGNYCLVALLGRGGYAEVYLGQHVRLPLQAAIKVLHAHLSDTEAEHFQQEAQTIAKLTSTNARPIAEICVRLDGLPLAIELAAARIKLLPPPALLTRLEHRLQMLTGGAQNLPARQQTLRNTITWSYDLLSDREQRLFRRLSIFVGGCTLQAIEAIYAAFGEEVEPVLDAVALLIDKSLLHQME